mmetsp:Transcript_67436/g.180171  ORF Transcript_67436/g.180171 Transcript_67436/m.180171 type:complete len:329 (+) Transcript_67436:253-1239(+)
MVMKQQSSEASPKTLVAAFVLAVTTEVRHCKDWITKKGQNSIPNALERMIPKKFRIMNKIAVPAFLKVIEGKCGFRRIRIRRQGLDSESGDLVYCNRRWLRPSVSADRSLLERNYEALCFAFPSFGRCSLETFLEVLEDVGTSWGAVLGKIRSRAPDAKFCSPCASPEQGSSLAPSRAPSVFGSSTPTSDRAMSRSSAAMDLGNLLNPDDSDSDGSHAASNPPAFDAPSRSRISEAVFTQALLLDALTRASARDRSAAAAFFPSFPRLPTPACSAAALASDFPLPNVHALPACGHFGLPHAQQSHHAAHWMMAGASAGVWPWAAAARG